MKISIITVCCNEVDTIESTIKSVLKQKSKDFEYIVVDGDSTDGTKKIIEKYRNFIDVFVSEKDKGIYDAMNRGLRRTSGDYVFFLNANDRLFNNCVIGDIKRELKKNSVDIAYGNIMVDGELNKFNKVDRWFLVKNTICHQAIVCKKSLFKKYGFFSLDYQIASDYNWLLNLFFNKEVSKKYFDITIVDFSMDGVSNDKRHRAIVLSEYKTIRKKYFGLFEIFFYKIYSSFMKFWSYIKKVFL